MSDTQTRTPARRSAAKLNMDKLGDVLAGKGQPPSLPAGAEQRGTTAPVSLAPVTAEPASTEPAIADPKRKGPKGILTSLEVERKSV